VAARQWADAPPGLDFLRYDRAGALVARGDGAKIYDPISVARSEVWGDRERLPERSFRYPPCVAVLFAPLGEMEPRTAWQLWRTGCVLLVVAGVGAAVAAALTRERGALPAFLVVLLAFTPMYVANVAEGQMNLLVFGLLAGAAFAFSRGRDRTAGALAGAAAAIKIAPVLLLLWFAWKRRWKPFFWGCGAIVAISWLLPVAVLGPSTAHALLRQWAGMEQPLVTEVDERPGSRANVAAVNIESQSLRGILVRTCTPTPYFRLRDKPLEMDAGGASPGISVHGGRRWSPGALRTAWMAAFFALVAAAVFATAPRPGEEPAAAARRLPLEAGLVLALIPLVSPESRWIHFLVLAPACAALAASLAAAERRGGTWWAAAIAGGLGAILLALPVFGAETLLAWGAAGWAGILVFIASALTLFAERASGTTPAAVPAAPNS
jgi:hypothetical protein